MKSLTNGQRIVTSLVHDAGKFSAAVVEANELMLTDMPYTVLTHSAIKEYGVFEVTVKCATKVEAMGVFQEATNGFIDWRMSQQDTTERQNCELSKMRSDLESAGFKVEVEEETAAEQGSEVGSGKDPIADKVIENILADFIGGIAVTAAMNDLAKQKSEKNMGQKMPSDLHLASKPGDTPIEFVFGIPVSATQAA